MSQLDETVMTGRSVGCSGLFCAVFELETKLFWGARCWPVGRRLWLQLAVGLL